MSEKCKVCQRESFPNGKDGYQHNLCFRAVMPERECYRLGYERVTAELAAAEERGRRRGVEEIPESVKLIAAERKRQVEQEHWTPSHDDTHNDGELASAAACYALYEQRNPPKIWPWDREWWKPGTDPIRRLVKAGALIAAEIERLQRAALAPRDSGPACDAVLSSDPFREWRCGKPKDHEGPHSGEAPRDSGNTQ